MWTRRVKTKTTQTYIHVLVTIAHKKGQRIEDERDRDRERTLAAQQKLNGKNFDRLYLWYVNGFLSDSCVQARERASEPYNSTQRYNPPFCSISFYRSNEEIVRATMKKKRIHSHGEREERKSVYYILFFHLNWMRVYCDLLIPFLRGANTQQAQKKKKKKNNNNKSYTKRVYTDLMVRVRALVQWFCLLFLGILAVDVYRVSQSPWMEVNANERITQKKKLFATTTKTRAEMRTLLV